MAVYYSPYLLGGLGNQMFQVASVYGLSRKHNTNYIFNENNIDNSQTILHSKNKYNDYFNTIFSTLTKYKNNSIQLKIFREPFHQIGQIHNLVFTENTLFYGYYQNYHNWDGFENEIKNLFHFENKTEINKKYDVDNSFFIHFRRGDYVNNKYHEVTTVEYYKKALEKFKTKKILIFSNEKDYGLELDFLKDYEKVFVDEDEITSMHIMKNCKYGGICANSSFSWWGGYLNTSKEKIITVPYIWFGDVSGIKDYSGYFCDDFNVIIF